MYIDINRGYHNINRACININRANVYIKRIIFNVPASCLPSPKPAPRPAKIEDQQLSYVLQKDKITSFDAFTPERNLQKQHKNLSLKQCQFDETVRLAIDYDIPFDKTIQNVVTLLQAHTSACVDTEEKKLVFLTRQLELLLKKQFSMNDYCFALQSYPKCNYEQLRDFLVLPCKRKLQYITSSIDKDQVLRETFDKVQTLQLKNVFLLVDGVQIRPTVSFSGGLLSDMTENNRDCKATSILITRRQGTVRVKERQYSDDYYTHSICYQPLRERLAEECSPSSDLCQEGLVG
ncbi:hypothetical protein FHG87_001171 [Trinorchestia longiramus]|nr:hypothetical protein FHG87_001171 [Trinorchestia longiramus]